MQLAKVNSVRDPIDDVVGFMKPASWEGAMAPVHTVFQTAEGKQATKLCSPSCGEELQDTNDHEMYKEYKESKGYSQIAKSPKITFTSFPRKYIL